MVVIVALKHGTKGITSYASIFIGIIVGYIVVTIMAQVLPTTYEYVNAAGETSFFATKSWVLDWQQVKDASWFAVPKLLPVGLKFDAERSFQLESCLS